MLILICGLPGTGKSTIAMRLAGRLRASLLRTDVVRKRLFPSPTYTEEEKELVYKVTFLIAEYLLRAGVCVIIDGTFYRRSLRRMVYQVAERAGVRTVVIECTAPEQVVRRRMERRRGRNLPTDADFTVYLRIREQWEPLQRERIVVDTSKSISQNLGEIMEHLRGISHTCRRG